MIVFLVKAKGCWFEISFSWGCSFGFDTVLSIAFGMGVIAVAFAIAVIDACIAIALTTTTTGSIRIAIAIAFTLMNIDYSCFTGHRQH